MQLSSKFPGEYISSGDQQHFLPGDIYLVSNIFLGSEVRQRAEEALWALGKFSYVIENMTASKNFIDAYKVKEATETSRIEGTLADMKDVYAATAASPEEKMQRDLEEIRAYLKAWDRALDLLQDLPVGSRLFRETHAVLLDHPCGKDKWPGEIRPIDVWVGRGSYVPPPYRYVPLAMENLDKFIQDDKVEMHVMAKMALLHYQFETIHPFVDGNGRLGRMLISLFLQSQGFMTTPTLYISAYFSKNRKEYYQRLNEAGKSSEGLISWLLFFLNGVIEITRQGVETAEKINKLKEKCADIVKTSNGRQIEADLKFLGGLFLNPVVSNTTTRQKTGAHRDAAARTIRRFASHGILAKMNDSQKSSVYFFAEYLKLLEDQ